MDKMMNIQKYSSENESEYRLKIRKIPKAFDILRDQDFLMDKTIYLLEKRNLFNRVKAIGYAIIYDLAKIESKEKGMYAVFVFKAQEAAFINHNGIFISDFMVDRFHRRKGLGTEFFKTIMNTYYPNEGILLVANGDGKKFWPKLGFVTMDSATKTMLLSQ